MQPYIHLNGIFAVTTRVRSINDDNDVWIELLSEHQLSRGGICLSHTDADTLAHDLIAHLYEQNLLSMDTAERVEFLCASVIAERHPMPADTTDPDGDLTDPTRA